MTDKSFYLNYSELIQTLMLRLQERAPTRIQLICGPRQVGKTTALLELAGIWGDRGIYASMDGPEALVAGFWERLWSDAERLARDFGVSALFLDEIQHQSDWSVRLKSEWDRVTRMALPIHVVASGSSSLELGLGSKESLAGRFERLTLPHWSPAALAKTYELTDDESVEYFVSFGSYPGTFAFRNEPRRWQAYVRDAIIEPAIGKDILALNTIRRPALLRQIFMIAATIPAQIISLQKLQGQLQDRGALATIAHYLELLENAFLLGIAHKFTNQPLRQREAPPKIIVLNQAICAALDSRGVPTAETDPARFGAWVENACLSFLWNRGHQVKYWREEPFEVDAIIDDGAKKWAIEIKTGRYGTQDLKGLLEFTSRYPEFRPLVLCDETEIDTAKRIRINAISWRRFLIEGLPNI